MENTMTNELGNLISKNLDLNLFFSININKNSIRILGDYSKATLKYLEKKSFEQKDYCYADDKNRFELENGNIRIVLIKKQDGNN
jgi:hypothetical protein